SGTSARAPRAAFARARLVLGRGDQERGFSLLIAAVRAFPDSGLAERAASDYLDHVSAQRGPEAAAALALALARELEGREVEERLRYEHAKRLEALGRTTDALAAYVDLARRFPYPEGGYWDQALLRAAELELTLERPARALTHLEALLAERERSRITGSYERPAFAQARFRIAEIHRDAFRDAARARAEFRRVWTDHPKSLLGDDALFEEARMALAMGDREGACAAARLLVEAAPDSRFARCGTELCPSLAPSDGRGCPAYVRQRITGAEGAQAPPRHSSSSSSSSSSSR
ncbi:MAG: tetratricopeptide repeat protein, partial [Pseudomonadota bacterium]